MITVFLSVDHIDDMLATYSPCLSLCLVSSNFVVLRFKHMYVHILVSLEWLGGTWSQFWSDSEINLHDYLLHGSGVNTFGYLVIWYFEMFEFWPFSYFWWLKYQYRLVWFELISNKTSQKLLQVTLSQPCVSLTRILIQDPKN